MNSFETFKYSDQMIIPYLAKASLKMNGIKEFLTKKVISTQKVRWKKKIDYKEQLQIFHIWTNFERVMNVSNININNGCYYSWWGMPQPPCDI